MTQYAVWQLDIHGKPNKITENLEEKKNPGGQGNIQNAHATTN